MATPLSFLRRLTLSILMPLLVLSQLGAILHELSHWHPAIASSSAGQGVHAPDVDHDLCLTCLGYAQIAGLANFDVPAAPKMDGLRFHFVPESVRSVAESSLPAARSRGPPAFV